MVWFHPCGNSTRKPLAVQEVHQAKLASGVGVGATVGDGMGVGATVGIGLGVGLGAVVGVTPAVGATVGVTVIFEVTITLKMAPNALTEIIARR